MSWYSDEAPFDEHDPEYCSNCEGGTSYEKCKACTKLHEEDAEEEGEE